MAYKFVEARYLRSLLKYGSIRLGTLSGYRPADGYDGARSDDQEGASIWHLNTGDSATFPRGHPYLQAMGFDYPALQTLTLASTADDVKLVMHMDAHLFCMSSEINTEIVARMRREFGCDACYRVADLEVFAQRILDGLDGDIRMHRGFVSYSDEPNFKGSVRAMPEFNPFRKREAYSWQKEVRLTFDYLGNPPLQPVNLRIPHLGNLVMPVDLSPYE